MQTPFKAVTFEPDDERGSRRQRSDQQNQFALSKGPRKWQGLGQRQRVPPKFVRRSPLKTPFYTMSSLRRVATRLFGTLPKLSWIGECVVVR